MTTEIPILTTILPQDVATGDTANKDILLVVASVAMVVATVLLIVVVKIVEKCIPSDKPFLENLEQKKERITVILDKHSKSLTYAEWILAERMKHQETSMPAMSSQASPTAKAPPDDSAPVPVTQTSVRNVSASELSAHLASSPKEDEVWATDCAVCLGEFDEEEQVRELECEHIFHHDCIYDWFMKARTAACPLCRNQLHSGLSTDNIASAEVPPTGIPVDTV